MDQIKTDSAATIALMVLILIIIIYIALVFIKGSGDTLEAGMIVTIMGALFLGILFGKYWNSNFKIEGLIPVMTDVLNNDGDVDIDVDDVNSQSLYNNVSVSNDIDSMEQRPIQLDVGSSKDFIDNSDIVELIVQGGDNTFMPSAGIPVSSTSSAEMSTFTLGAPSGLPYMDDAAGYDIPSSGRGYNLDELLAKKQMHRGAMNKKALTGAVRSTRNIYQKYFQNELSENAGRVWWSNEGDNADNGGLETDFTPYDINA
jgi:hypothetical protein